MELTSQISKEDIDRAVDFTPSLVIKNPTKVILVWEDICLMR